MKVFGLVGALGTGKTTAAEMLVKKGLLRVSLTDELQKEVKKMGLPITRQVFLDVADNLRQEMGNDYLARKASETLENKAVNEEINVVFDGIKNPGEVEYLKTKYKMTLIGLIASEENRMKRILERASLLDKNSSESMLNAQLKRDLGVGQKDYGNKVNECMELADVYIENDGTLSELDKKISAVIINQQPV